MCLDLVLRLTLFWLVAAVWVCLLVTFVLLFLLVFCFALFAGFDLWLFWFVQFEFWCVFLLTVVWTLV